jgi:NADP-dependent 3-hydroxy acid dehydrogenase YdfG
MTETLAKRTALITGASAGIGAALAVDLAEKGVTVGIAARRENRLAEVLDKCRAHTPNSQMFVADVADSQQVDALAEAALDQLGPIDILINNAGMPKRRAVTALDPETIELVMATNYHSAARLTLRLLPHLLEQPRAHIVSVSSIAAKLAAPGEAAYDASKAAVSAFFEAMAVELYDTDVSVHLIYPAIIDTELFDLPDNDPLPPTPVEALPPSAVVEAIVDQLTGGPIEAWVPPMFRELAAGRAADLDSFIEGTAQWLRDGAVPAQEDSP